MKNWMRFIAAFLAVMLLTVPVLAEENAKASIVAHKANGIVIDGSLADWNLDSPAVVNDYAQIVRDPQVWQGPNDSSVIFIWLGMKKTSTSPRT